MENGYGIFDCNGIKIFVTNILGKNLGGKVNGFKIISKILDSIDKDIKIKIVDFHSEYCNEKMAMAYMLRDDVSAVYGTHTHVQTSDERILNNKVGYITDIGMCGPIDSAIGYNLEFEIRRYLEELTDDSILSDDNNCQLNGVILTIDSKTGNTIDIKRISK